MQIETPTTIENENFKHQTIYMVEQDYKNCTFVECTIVLRNSSHIGISDCRFIHCNWHVDFLFSQENRNVVGALKTIVSMIAENKFSYKKNGAIPN
ncbi:MAG: hypothetical protein ACRC80_09165 [Waterburya sp.]